MWTSLKATTPQWTYVYIPSTAKLKLKESTKNTAQDPTTVNNDINRVKNNPFMIIKQADKGGVIVVMV